MEIIPRLYNRKLTNQTVTSDGLSPSTGFFVVDNPSGSSKICPENSVKRNVTNIEKRKTKNYKEKAICE